MKRAHDVSAALIVIVCLGGTYRQIRTVGRECNKQSFEGCKISTPFSRGEL